MIPRQAADRDQRKIPAAAFLQKPEHLCALPAIRVQIYDRAARFRTGKYIDLFLSDGKGSHSFVSSLDGSLYKYYTVSQMKASTQKVHTWYQTAD